MKKIVNSGVDRLAQMQLSDGGWGWFSGWGEQSWPHTTAVVVHGLQISRQNDVKLPAEHVRARRRLAEELPGAAGADAQECPGQDLAVEVGGRQPRRLRLHGPGRGEVLNGDMRDFLYRDRVGLSVYAKAMFGIALHQEQQAEKLAMILKNMRAVPRPGRREPDRLPRLPEGNYWWYWYGSEIESNAYYLKLLSRTNAKDERASRLVKYLLNNRKHSTYWN